MICDNLACGCAVTSDTLTVSGSGTPADPWRLEQAEFTDITQLQVDVANINAALAALPATYVNVTGDGMSGSLTVNSMAGGTSLRCIRNGTARPFIEFYDTTNTILQAVLVGADTGVEVNSWTGIIKLMTAGANRVVVDDTVTIFHKSASNVATVGGEISALGTWLATRGDSASTAVFNKVSTGATASGSVFAEFKLAGTTIGSITRNAVSSAVLFNPSSDADLKTVLGDFDPELAEYVLGLIPPEQFYWNVDPDQTPTPGYIAQHVAEALPQSVDLGLVTPGWGDPADRTFDSDGNETTPDDVWHPWQMATSTLIPILHASLNRTTTKLSYLRAEYDDLKVEHDQLKADYADLEARVAALEAIAKPK